MRIMQNMEQKRQIGVLTGVKVLDLSLLLPGPMMTMYLGDMGAEVIKVENPKIGDGTRYIGNMEGQDKSLLFEMVNRNKKAITLNIKREQGRELLLRLLSECDVLVEGFRPGAMAKMRLSYNHLKDRFPRLIYCAISGYGSDGPRSEMAGHDANYMAQAGLLSQTGNAQSGPILPGFQLADIGGGTMVALSAILGALYAREKTNLGQFLDISMTDGVLAYQSLIIASYLQGHSDLQPGQWLLSGKLPNYQIYRSRDGRYLALAALEERFFRHFLKKIGRPDLDHLYDKVKQADPTDQNAMFQQLQIALSQLFLSHDAGHWQALYEDADTCLSLILNVDEVLNQPFFHQRNMVFTMPSSDGQPITHLGCPLNFSLNPVNYRLSAPSQGQHNEEIYGGLGLSATEMEQFKRMRIV